MSESPALYPPTPTGIPADLATPGLRYRLQIVLVLLTLLLFALLYLALLAMALILLYWAVRAPAEGAIMEARSWPEQFFLIVLRVGFYLMAALLFAFLLKGFFKRSEDATARYVEVSEPQQPELFQFLRALCREIGCPVPARVYLSHEVNAAVFYRLSILGLIVPPPKHLLIGLGLIDGLNLLEFKALLAHELGHFSQRSLRLSGYALVTHRVLNHLVYARDRWDDWMLDWYDAPVLSALVVPLYMLAGVTRALLGRVFRVLSLAHLSLRRQMELNADLVAVSVAGSDAPVELLFKSDFSEAC